MPKRLAGPLLTALVGLLTIVSLAACGQASNPQTSPSPSASPVTTLQFGETAVVGGFKMTPTRVADRTGDIYDAGGNVIKGKGITIAIKIRKTREADTSGSVDEFVAPVATIVDAEGASQKADDLLGLTSDQTQTLLYIGRYKVSYQRACARPAGTASRAWLWFNVPKGFSPEKLVIDAGVGQQAAWAIP